MGQRLELEMHQEALLAEQLTAEPSLDGRRREAAEAADETLAQLPALGDVG